MYSRLIGLCYFVGGRRAGLTLASILQFSTAADEEPVLGFGTEPSLKFYEVVYFPSNSKHMFMLPATAKCNVPLPGNQDLFSLYDLAFVNAYFGHR